MSRPVITQVHIADGFVDDCDELIYRCSQVGTLNYHTFCEIWKSMNFSGIYDGRTSHAEIAELSEEVLYIGKHYLIANTSVFEESVAGLFLVYALLNLQPYPGFVPLRVAPEDVPVINRIEVVARRERRYDVLYILGNVLIKGPCHYHAASRERGLESSIRKYFDGYTSIDRRGVRPKGVFYRQNVELDVIRELNCLTRWYSQHKQHISDNINYANENLPAELDTSLKELINGFVPETGVGVAAGAGAGGGAAGDGSDGAGGSKNAGGSEGAGGGEGARRKEDADGASSSRYNTVQAIKARAMGDAVDSMKHLVSLKNRSSSVSPKKKSELSSKGGRVKTGRPKKPLTTGSPKKRRAPSKRRKAKVLRKEHKSSESDDADEDMKLSDSEDRDSSEANDLEEAISKDADVQPLTCMPVLSESMPSVSDSMPPLSDSTPNLQDVTKGNENPTVVIEIGDDMEISPGVTIEKILRSNTENMEVVEGNDYVEIEFIDQIEGSASPEKTTAKKLNINKATEAGNVLEPAKDTHVFKKPNEVSKKSTRISRKRHDLKSKFKRMGMMAVANFDDPTKNTYPNSPNLPSN